MHETGIEKRFCFIVFSGANTALVTAQLDLAISAKSQKRYFIVEKTPIENLSYALSESGSLYLNSKAKNTDHQNYKSVLENKGDLGLIDLFGASEIYEKKNLFLLATRL